MLSYLRYNRISNGDYCKSMCLYCNECEIPELSNILDFTVVFTPPPFFAAIFPAVFDVCPISGLFFGLRATPKTKEVKSFIFHSIARLRRPPASPACIRYRVFKFLAKIKGFLATPTATQVGRYLYRTSAVFSFSGSATCREKQPVSITT